MAKKRRFIHNALMMSVAVFALRAIGTAFGIYISNEIGAEGLGLYQLAAAVYMFAVTLATSGITTAVTRVVSERLAFKNPAAAKYALKKCLLLGGAMGILSGLLLFFNADRLGNHLLSEPRVILSLKLLSLGLPFLSIAAVLRGYFLGESEPIKAVSGDFVEQFSAIALTLPMLGIGLKLGLEYACCAIVIGSGGSELISCVYSYILYLSESKKKEKGVREKGITRQIFSIILPIAFSNYIRSALTLIENLLIPKGLRSFGASRGESLSQYGIIKGMAMPLLTFPAAVLSAFSSLLVPEISYANALKNDKRIFYITNRCLKFTLLFAIFITGMFLFFSYEISALFYNQGGVGIMLQILAPLVPLLYMDQIVDSILKGLNQQMSSMKYNTADAIMRTLIVWFTIPKMGLKGYIIMLYAGTIFNAWLSLNRLITVSRIKFRPFEWVVLPSFAAAFSCAAVKFCFDFSVIFSIFAAALAYFILLFIFKCVKKSDIIWIAGIFYKKTNLSE